VIKNHKEALVKAKKYTEEQIIAVLREAEAGVKVAIQMIAS
jgi:hypothetical protein